jgi:hypothetical protein
MYFNIFQEKLEEKSDILHSLISQSSVNPRFIQPCSLCAGIDSGRFACYHTETQHDVFGGEAWQITTLCSIAA